ncbi:hypothetical protein [Lysinibacillus pakistanensis]|uniref:YhfM-like domain-containing protein n=1 Tax=Lysinibacillus pakistanensis TaxID=759811 RepID=A0AAX3X1R4_9BACI|nr:hypothetical protein [Lysinibacillus pakistanensis]MDM5233451.1 hypothetical protein [Lysinibacillus pakistanensis]WHY48923.1 hypothetical protein QNH22_12080 [Lysinibacillus pakistanensis]WHY53934.1 hypothetical protein QNH24_12060 [Lysinibacillus pakistanensis]
MKKMFIIFVLLFLVGCNNEEMKTFEFAGEIQKIIVIGQGTNAKLDKQEVENATQIKLFEDAMQDANILSQPHTDEGPLYKLEVMYSDNSKEIIDIWYYASANTGRFYMNDMYSLNEEAIPALIEFFESYKEVK